MTLFYDKDNYKIRGLTRNRLRELRAPILDTVYNNYTSFDTKGINPNLQAQEKLGQLKEEVYSLNLGLFYCDELIGWSDGIQTVDSRYHMKNSGVVEAHRGKGLYNLLLSTVLEETKKQGFLEVYSNHNTDNNAILIAKLKKGFFISGFEVLPKYGLTVQLTYCHSAELKKMFDYRAGRPLDKLIEGRFLT